MTDQERERALTVVSGLMEIAEMAMPDTYFQSDSRVNAAREFMRDLTGKEGE